MFKPLAHVCSSVALSALSCSLAAAPPATAPSRGELLYTTHCISCHTSEMHWRDNRAANSWAGLKGQVRRWQDASSLGWSDADILDVSRYLNDSIYHFEQAEESAFLSGPAATNPLPN